MKHFVIFLSAGLAGGIVAALTTFLWMYAGGRVPPTIVTAIAAVASGTLVAYLVRRRLAR